MSSRKASVQTAYEQLGGEHGVSALVRKFYALMDEQPEAWEIRKLHPDDLTGSEEKLFKFLTGWLGGPPLYVQEYGHPMLRRRHLPFSIGIRERDQWVMCMRQALEDQPISASLRSSILTAIESLADHMRNQPQ